MKVHFAVLNLQSFKLKVSSITVHYACSVLVEVSLHLRHFLWFGFLPQHSCASCYVLHVLIARGRERTLAR